MHKSILVFIYLFSSSLSQTTYIYKPMTKRTKDFDEDVCLFPDYSENIIYVKPCREGKSCINLGSSSNNIHSCIDYGSEYNNLDQTCVTRNNVGDQDFDCTTGLSCNTNGKCGVDCPENQVLKTDDDTCVPDTSLCWDNSDSSVNYAPGTHKRCVELEIESSDSKTYTRKKIKSNYIASIDDGKFIDDQFIQTNGFNYMKYCKSGYALYFYGNKQLNNPNIDNLSRHEMFLMCVSILGKDKNRIIKYKIGDGEEKYYNSRKLPSSYSLYLNDEFLMTRIECFNYYKKRMDQLNCRATGCEDNELTKWEYCYDNPEEYMLYKNEPQIIEYLIKENYGNYNYKVYHTSSTESSSILNIKYLIAILSLLLLF